jgi:hypothetical protein
VRAALKFGGSHKYMIKRVVVKLGWVVWKAERQARIAAGIGCSWFGCGTWGVDVVEVIGAADVFIDIVSV